MSEVTSPVAPTLLFVDDELNILSSLKRLFRPLGYRILTVSSGEEGLELLEKESVDLIISDMRMPEMDGATFLKKTAEKWPDTMRILLTGYADLGSTIAAVNQGKIYSYISKPWEDHELTLAVQQALKLKQLEDEKTRLEALTHQQNEALAKLNTSLEVKVSARTNELRQTMTFLEEAHASLKKQYTISIKIFANLIELRESTIEASGEKSDIGHSRRVAEQARKLGVAMGLSKDALQDLLFAALLHDIGKIALPDVLLKRPYNEMSNQERKEFEKHPILGQAALVALEPLNAAAELIRAHHEHVDGRGYPDQLQDDAIPLGARILAVIDDYNALLVGKLFPRCYTRKEACDFLLKERNRRYDATVVDHFITLLESEQQQGPILAEQCLKLSALKNGMVLTRDLVAPNGVLLLATGHQLNDELINKIGQLERRVGCNLLFYIISETKELQTNT